MSDSLFETLELVVTRQRTKTPNNCLKFLRPLNEKELAQDLNVDVKRSKTINFDKNFKTYKQFAPENGEDLFYNTPIINAWFLYLNYLHESQDLESWETDFGELIARMVRTKAEGKQVKERQLEAFARAFQNLRAKQKNVMMPICFDCTNQIGHWILICFELGKNPILHIYDSGCGEKKRTDLEQWIGVFAKWFNSNVNKPDKPSSFSLVFEPVPQQVQGWECGTFVCIFARLLMGKCPLYSFDTNPKSIRNFQRRMGLEMLNFNPEMYAPEIKTKKPEMTEAELKQLLQEQKEQDIAGHIEELFEEVSKVAIVPVPEFENKPEEADAAKIAALEYTGEVEPETLFNMQIAINEGNERTNLLNGWKLKLANKLTPAQEKELDKDIQAKLKAYHMTSDQGPVLIHLLMEESKAAEERLRAMLSYVRAPDIAELEKFQPCMIQLNSHQEGILNRLSKQRKPYPEEKEPDLTNLIDWRPLYENPQSPWSRSVMISFAEIFERTSTAMYGVAILGKVGKSWKIEFPTNFPKSTYPALYLLSGHVPNLENWFLLEFRFEPLSIKAHFCTNDAFTERDRNDELEAASQLIGKAKEFWAALSEINLTTTTAIKAEPSENGPSICLLSKLIGRNCLERSFPDVVTIRKGLLYEYAMSPKNMRAKATIQHIEPSQEIASEGQGAESSLRTKISNAFNEIGYIFKIWKLPVNMEIEISVVRLELASSMDTKIIVDNLTSFLEQPYGHGLSFKSDPTKALAKLPFWSKLGDLTTLESSSPTNKKIMELINAKDTTYIDSSHDAFLTLTWEEKVATVLHDQVYLDDFTFPSWVMHRFDEIYTTLMPLAEVWFFGGSLNDAMKLVKQREPVHLRGTTFNVRVLETVFGWKQSYYNAFFQKFKKLAPNIAVYTPTFIQGKGMQVNPRVYVHILNVIGVSLRDKGDSDYLFYENLEEKAMDNALRDRYTKIMQMIFHVAKQLNMEHVIMPFFGIEAPLYSKLYPKKRLFTDIWIPSFEAAIASKSAEINVYFIGRREFLPGFKSLESFAFTDSLFPEFLQQFTNKLNKTLIVNSWNPISIAGNGNFADDSLDGQIGRVTNISVVSTSMTNPYLLNKDRYHEFR
jgi:hypothetical protein